MVEFVRSDPSMWEAVYADPSVPLDRALTERFAAWLTPRVLTEKERCLFGVSNEACR